VSTALKVRRALVAAISQHPTFRNRAVEFSHPGVDGESEMVYVAGVRAAENARTLGKAYRREELTVELGVLCELLGRDIEEPLERAHIMLDAVHEAIYEDTSLGGVVHVAEVTAWDERSFIGPEKCICEISVDVRVLADFTGTES
jgi:hypothetical protein